METQRRSRTRRTAQITGFVCFVGPSRSAGFWAVLKGTDRANAEIVPPRMAARSTTVAIDIFVILRLRVRTDCIRCNYGDKITEVTKQSLQELS